MLNIMAALHPNFLRAPQYVIDKSQTIGRASGRVDGTIPTLTTTSDIFSFGDGCSLSPSETAKLMGHNVACINFDGVSNNHWRISLGMSVHVGIAGLILAGLIASIGSG